MRKHRLDLFSLLAGALFTTVAGLYLAASFDAASVDNRIVVPVTLIVLGIAGLGSAILAVSRRNRGD